MPQVPFGGFASAPPAGIWAGGSGGRPVQAGVCGVFDCHPLNASSPPPHGSDNPRWQPSIAKCPLGAKLALDQIG